MKSIWLRDLSDEDKEELAIKLKQNKLLFGQQAKMLERWVDDEVTALLSEEEFTKPAYAELQAYRKGKIKAYKELLGTIKDLTS